MNIVICILSALAAAVTYKEGLGLVAALAVTVAVVFGCRALRNYPAPQFGGRETVVFLALAAASIAAIKADFVVLAIFFVIPLEILCWQLLKDDIRDVYAAYRRWDTDGWYNRILHVIFTAAILLAAATDFFALALLFAMGWCVTFSGLFLRAGREPRTRQAALDNSNQHASGRRNK